MRKLLIVLTVVLTLSIAFASSARATAWTVGSGTFTIVDQTNTIVGQVGCETLVHGTRQGSVAGTLRGTYAEDILIAIGATGALTFTGTDTCTCFAANHSGTVTA